MSDSRPIGVFDSGIGGLTVVKALRDILPNEKIFYLGDTARVPYGGKSASTVEHYSLEIRRTSSGAGYRGHSARCAMISERSSSVSPARSKKRSQSSFPKGRGPTKGLLLIPG
jgi:hypothetical protein